jgi:PAS domain S-box-containing protein
VLAKVFPGGGTLALYVRRDARRYGTFAARSPANEVKTARHTARPRPRSGRTRRLRPAARRKTRARAARPSAPASWETRLCELELRLVQMESENRRLREAYHQLEAFSADRAASHDLSPVALLTLDAHGNILDLTRAAANLLSRQKTWLFQRPFVFLVAREDIPKFTAHLRQCRRSRAGASCELTVRGPGGGTVSVQLVSVPVRDAKKRVSRFETALLDLTEHKRTEDALSAGERNLRALIEASPTLPRSCSPAAAATCATSS